MSKILYIVLFVLMGFLLFFPYAEILNTAKAQSNWYPCGRCLNSEEYRLSFCARDIPGIVTGCERNSRSGCNSNSCGG
jgi:hypothetical protein